MREAVRNYADYSTGDDSWALGRFVVPISRLDEFDDAARPFVERAIAPWRLSALAGPSGGDEWARIASASRRNAVVDAIELPARTSEDVERAAGKLPRDIDAFFEIPIADDPGTLLAAIGRVGGRAKVRTGGVTADAFPPADRLARFIVACVRAGVPFKATAGLHHPLRATYRLTYAADSASGEMFGFLNVLLAASLMRAGLSDGDAARMLEESSASTIVFGDSDVRWREHTLTTTQIADARSSFAMSFGSCSFREPITDLMWLRLL